MHNKFKQMDLKELNLLDTTYVRDIETKVFHSITLKCLSKIKGIGLICGTLFGSILKRESILDNVKGIHIEQDLKKNLVNVKIDINIEYGVSIPEKAEEIQNRVTEEISSFTGLHVGNVHVVFKDVISFNKENILDL